MKTIILQKEQVHCGSLLLVNAAYPLRNRQKCALTPADPRFPNILLNRNAATVLQMILDNISADGSIVPVSGYRSEEEQTELYERSYTDNGAAFTKKYVALPNCSEHQTGLAIDLGLNKGDIDFICPDFPYNGISQRFRDEAPDYGFIERYPKDKEHITGISHEPWHFRYIGAPHSKIMAENHLSLEEYIEFVKAYRTDSRLSYERDKQTENEIYFVPASAAETYVSLPENALYQISGNNIDGFIITIWRKKQ